MVDRTGAARAMAADLFHALERAEDLSVAARGLCCRRLGILMAAVTHGARAASAAARAGAPGGARAIRRAPDRQYQEPQRRAHFRVTGGALRAHYRRRRHCAESAQ